MRVILIKQDTDLHGLRASLLAGGAAGGAGGNSVMERIRQLNPHQDFAKIRAGTVLLLPDDPRLAGAHIRSPMADAFAERGTRITNGLREAIDRVRAAVDAQGAQHDAVAKAVKSNAVTALLDSDPVLKQQLERVAKANVAELAKMRALPKQLEAMQAVLAKEMKSLQKLIR